MARVLVTRPDRAGIATAARIRAIGHEALVSPVLDIRAAPPERLFAASPDIVVMTSAAAPAAIAGHRDLRDLLSQPAFAVGDRTAEAARAIGFRVEAVAPDLVGLAPILARATGRDTRILHIAGVDRSGDLAALVGGGGAVVETTEVYRAAIVDGLPEAGRSALAGGRADAVMHFSRRSAEAFFLLADRADLGAPARRIAQFCIAAGVAETARAAGSSRIYVAEHPREDAMIDLIARIVR